MAVDYRSVVPLRAARNAAAAVAIATTFLVLVASGMGGWSSEGAFAQEGHPEGSAAARSPSAPSRSAAVALARLLPASGLIAVGARPGARVVEIKVKEDQEVSAGAVLAVLEGHQSARLQLELAEAQKKRGEHERTSRLAAARKAAEVTKRRLDEGQALYKQFGATLKGKERYDAEMALYQVEIQAIKTQLELELAQGPGAAGGNPEEAILKAQVDLAAAGLRDTEVRAPASGRVLRLLAHPGEISSGALLELGDVSSMIARAEVYQSDVPQIHVGDPAEVDILGTHVAGKVSRIGSIVGRNRLTSIDPRAMRDLRVVEVTIQLDKAEPAARFVEMEVEAVIRPDAGNSTRGAG